MTIRKSMTYGTLPSREEYEVAFAALPDTATNAEGHGVFVFFNDPRVGHCGLTESELWAELVKAHTEYLSDVGREIDSWTKQEAAGQWCSNVLGILGWEWV